MNMQKKGMLWNMCFLISVKILVVRGIETTKKVAGQTKILLHLSNGQPYLYQLTFVCVYFDRSKYEQPKSWMDIQIL